jgi:hypothetical protein
MWQYVVHSVFRARGEPEIVGAMLCLIGYIAWGSGGRRHNGSEVDFDKGREG